ncbi:MAG: phage integrase N-terminal SAM-like domain-containing protein, partial [Reinekea sp.]
QVEPFLSHLANERYCSVNTQRTALNALVFLFREYFNLNIGNLNFVPAKRNAKIPVVLSQQEA